MNDVIKFLNLFIYKDLEEVDCLCLAQKFRNGMSSEFKSMENYNFMLLEKRELYRLARDREKTWHYNHFILNMIQNRNVRFDET